MTQTTNGGRLKIRILYRSHPGSNDKARPEFFDRVTALRSLRRSAEAASADVDFTFVADGGLPSDLAAQRAPGERTVTVRGGTAAASFRACVAVALRMAQQETSDDVLYFLAEDDYLYRPDAFTDLEEAVSALPDVDYFSLYTPDDTDWFADHPSQPLRRLPSVSSQAMTSSGATWGRIAATTSTFGVRRRALVEDAGLLRLGARAGAPFDSATWYMLQGLRPYSWRHLLHDLDPYWSVRGLSKIVLKPPMRAVLNAASAVRRARPRLLNAPAPDLAMHMEIEKVTTSYDWRSLAGDRP